MNRDEFKKGAVEVTGASADGEVWNPGTTENGMPKFVATENDYRIGNYVTHKLEVGRNKSEVHVFQKADGKKFQVWGNKVIDEALASIRKEYGLGVMVCLEWKGRVIKNEYKDDYEKTAEADRPIKFPWNTCYYHKYTVSANPNAPRVTVAADPVYRTQTSNTPAGSGPPATPSPANLPTTLPETPAVVPGAPAEEDDLPY
jgi:hypothetical protein